MGKEKEFDVTAKVDGVEETDTITASSLKAAEAQALRASTEANAAGLDVEVESVKPHKG